MREPRAADTTPAGRPVPPGARPPTCGCPYEWKPFGRLYGVSMGDGWVRTGTSPDCIDHGEPAGRGGALMSDDLPVCLARHYPRPNRRGRERGNCDYCVDPWPCDAARAAERIRDLEADAAQRNAVAVAMSYDLGHEDARAELERVTAERDALAAELDKRVHDFQLQPIEGVPGEWCGCGRPERDPVHRTARRVLAALAPDRQPTPDVCEGCGQFATRGRYCDDCLGRVLAAIEGLPGGLAGQSSTPCCDLHGINCEPPAELCCRDCTEVDHPQHWTLGPCVLAGQPTTEETK